MLKRPQSKRCPAGESTVLWLLASLTCLTAPGQTLELTPRATNALAGADFAARAGSLPLAQREDLVISEVLAGNVPGFLRHLRPVSITSVKDGVTNRVTLHVTPDYLAIGSDQDYFLMPVSPGTAQRLADALKCTLPTRKMVDAIYAAAEVKLEPLPMTPGPAMTTMAVFSNHNALVRAQRDAQLSAHPLGALVAGHQKDVVITARLAESPGKVAIYGWHKTNGVPIQPLYLGHTAAWVDYSQCSRLVSDTCELNGASRRVPDILADPRLAGLLSDEGPVASARYPTNAVPDAPGVARPNSAETNLVRGPSGFRESGAFGERVAAFSLDPEVKVLVNVPGADAFKPGKRVLLVYFALPNGNTTDQTIGKTLKPGDDWHYDIQHIGAQTRFLRELLPGQTIVVAYLENDLKSWPAWRKKHGDNLIPGLLAEVRKSIPASKPQVVLTGHSGGGSLTFGYLNAVNEIPGEVERIAFLDSNYAYDSALGHREKLAAWLKASPAHSLCVLAYNDAIALLNGKSFVSAAGGTWGKSHEMQQDLAQDFTFTTRTDAEFQRFVALDGRVQFLLKENPERKVLHTVQVERNGFIHAMVTGTTNESRGYEYFGPRAYTNLVAETAR